jgi:hypothetical protein
MGGVGDGLSKLALTERLVEMAVDEKSVCTAHQADGGLDPSYLNSLRRLPVLDVYVCRYSAGAMPAIR